MEQLNTLDAGFLHAEDSDRHVSLAIGAVAVLAGPMPSFDSLVSTINGRVLAVPRFCQVLHTQPLDLGAPHWVDDADLDISHHIRLAALPRPGDDAALSRWVAEVMERRLDRDRPLWECWVVDGLAHNRWAILMKVHHCIADGIAATHMLSRICDDGAGDTFATDIRAAHESMRVLRLPALTLNPIEWIAGAWRTSVGVTTAAAQALQGDPDRGRPAAARGGVVTDRTPDQHAALRLGRGIHGTRDEHLQWVWRHDQRRCTGGDYGQLPHDAAASRRAATARLTSDARPGFGAFCRCVRRDRQPRLDHAAVPARREGRSRRAAASRAQAARPGQGQRTAPGREHLRIRRESDPVRAHRLDGPDADTTASARRRHPRDERAGSAKALARHGPRSRPATADPSAGTETANRNSDHELRRPPRIRRYRRLRRGPGCR